MADESASVLGHRLRAGLRQRLGFSFRTAYEYSVFYGLIVAFGIVSLLWSLPAAVLYGLLPRRLGASVGQFAVMAGFRFFVALMKASGIIKCDLSALAELNGTAPLVIAPNHPSLLDAVLILSQVPNVVCATKAKIWHNPLLGGGARLAGFIRNDAPTSLIRQALRQLRAGRHLLIFPEGTRTPGQSIGAFKGGFALIAKRAGTSVQTVFIESNSGFLGKGWPLYRKPAFPVVYRVRLGQRFAIEDDLRKALRQMHDYYRQELAADRR